MCVFASIEDVHSVCLVDTGANVSVISKQFLDELPSEVIRTRYTQKVRDATCANKSKVTILGDVTLSFTVGKQRFKVDFAVLEKCSMSVILGMDFLQKARAVIDIGQQQITFTDFSVVYATNTVTLEPFTEYYVTGNLAVPYDDGIEGETIGYSYLRYHKGLYLSKSACTVAEGNIPIRLYNGTSTPVSIHKGSRIAGFFPWKNDTEIYDLELQSIDRNGPSSTDKSTDPQHGNDRHLPKGYEFDVSDEENDAPSDIQCNFLSGECTVPDVGNYPSGHDPDIITPGARFHRSEIINGVTVHKQIEDLPNLTTNSDPHVPKIDYSCGPADEERLNTLKSLVNEFSDVFVNPDDPKIGLTPLVTGKIETLPGVSPVTKYPYRMNPHMKDELRKICQEQMDQGIIEFADAGAWSSPIMIISKPHNRGYRAVVDLRELNMKTQALVLRIPRVDDCLDEISQKAPQWFSQVDLKSGFHQIALDEESRPKTGFITPFGKFRYRTLPQGFRNSPAIFQAMIDTLLKGVQGEWISSYIDDLAIYSRTYEEHISHLRELFQRLRNAGLKLSPDKCKFAVQQIDFLGHVLTPEGRKPNPEKVEAVSKMGIPKTTKEVRMFLGAASYYRKFLKGFGVVAKPLYELTSKNVVFHWDELHQTAFDKVKSLLVKAPVLASPDFRAPFVLATDASALGMGACLSQEHDGALKPVGFAGRGFTKPESKYSVTEQELLAIVFAVNYFRVFLIGQPFEIRTDHNALRWILGLKEPSPRLARWIALLQQYDYTVKHVAGAHNRVPDCLSRWEYETPEVPMEEDPIYDVGLRPLQADISGTVPDTDMPEAAEHSDAPAYQSAAEFHDSYGTDSEHCDEAEVRNISVPTAANIQQDEHSDEPTVVTPERSDLECVTCGRTAPDYFPEEDSIAQSITLMKLTAKQAEQRRTRLKDALLSSTIHWSDPDLSPENIRRQQVKDPVCRRYIQYLATGSLPNIPALAKAILCRAHDYILLPIKSLHSTDEEPQYYDILYHIDVSREKGPQSTRAQVVVPHSLRAMFLRLYHDSLIGSHIGPGKLISIMKPRLFWHGMCEDIVAYCRSCEICIMAKNPTRYNKPPLIIREPVCGPMEELIIDTMGPFPMTARGNAHICVVVDVYSRFAFVFPTRNITASTVANKLFDHVITKFGNCRRLLSDNGTSFTGEVFRELCKIMGIKQIFSTSYHSKSQGQVERANRTIQDLMRGVVAEKPKQWDACLNGLCFTLNCTDSQPIGLPPFTLMFGRSPLLPSDIAFPNPLSVESKPWFEHLGDILDTQRCIGKKAMKRLKKQQKRMKVQYDKTAFEHGLTVGDSVFLFCPALTVKGIRRKLLIRWHGPYLIVKFNSPTAVILKRWHDGKVLEKSISVSRLKRAHLREKVTRWDPLPEDQLLDSELSEDDLPHVEFEKEQDPEPSGLNADNVVNDNQIADHANPQPDDITPPRDDDESAAEFASAQSELSDDESVISNPPCDPVVDSEHLNTDIDMDNIPSDMEIAPRYNLRGSRKCVEEKSSDSEGQSGIDDPSVHKNEPVDPQGKLSVSLKQERNPSPQPEITDRCSPPAPARRKPGRPRKDHKCTPTLPINDPTPSGLDRHKSIVYIVRIITSKTGRDGVTKLLCVFDNGTTDWIEYENINLAARKLIPAV